MSRFVKPFVYIEIISRVVLGCVGWIGSQVCSNLCG